MTVNDAKNSDAGIALINNDCLQYVKEMPDDSVDLIVTDPPYFKVKSLGWDNQWNGDKDFLRSSRPGDVVADFFMGSGSTIEAARKLGRYAIGIELEEERFNQIVGE